ncbi:MAG: LCP family protein [Synechococcaceae cyanobacterium]|nr:LCP family protein [Synechococcaceae cyanobacterium]
MALGLSSGLALALPMAELLSTHQLRVNSALTNPFAAWNSATDEDLLLLGTDEGGGNTDVIATLRIDGGSTRITQIPRDSYIESDQYGPIKINALYSLGGVQAVKSELSHRLGRPLQHHLVINLAAIRRLADQIGGIEVTVPKRMRYVDHSQGLNIDLQPGRQVLRGRDLEGFLRFRHDEMGDIGRLERQQLALKALFRKLTSPEQLVRLPGLMMSGHRDLVTDLGPMELGGLLTAMGSTELSTQRLGGQPFDRDGISYWQTEWPSGNPESDAAEAVPAASDPPGRPYRLLF